MVYGNLFAGGAIPQYASGAAMDVGAFAGRKAELIGTTTRGVIALLECSTVGPVTYRTLGPIAWWQADGDEFTGVFGVEDQGAATHTWGVAGSRATGGLINEGDGAQFIRGLVYLRGVQRFLGADVRLETLALATGNGAWLGSSRAAAPTLFSGGGLGVDLTPSYACAAFVAKSLAAPALTTNVAFLAAPSTANAQRLWVSSDAFGTGANTEVSRAGIAETGGQSQLGSSASLGNNASIDDRVVVISGLNIRARHLTLEITGFAA